MKRGVPGPGGLARQVALGGDQPGARPSWPIDILGAERRSSPTTPGPTASCARARTRSRAARPRSSRTSSPSASWGCRAECDELRPHRRPAGRSSAPRASSSPRATRGTRCGELALEEERGFTDAQWEEMAELGWPELRAEESAARARHRRAGRARRGARLRRSRRRRCSRRWAAARLLGGAGEERAAGRRRGAGRSRSGTRQRGADAPALASTTAR